MYTYNCQKLNETFVHVLRSPSPQQPALAFRFDYVNVLREYVCVCVCIRHANTYMQYACMPVLVST